MITIELPAAVADCIATLGGLGYIACAVGGCVRDSLIGRAPSDWDVCSSALPEEVIAAFPERRVLPTGIEHGTVTLLGGEIPVEITTLRRDGDYRDHRRPVSVEFSGSLDDDLARRDFTVNAMAYHPAQGLLDPFGGADDLAAGILRCVGDPERRFNEDALRILRLFRFMSQLSFTPEPDCIEAAGALKGLLAEISAERVSAEFSKLLLGQNVYEALRLCAGCGVLGAIIPEFIPCIGLRQRKRNHIHTVDTHTFAAVAAAPARLELRLALFLHDVGKPYACAQTVDGPDDFTGHAEISAAYAERILNRLRYPNRLSERVVLLTAEHCRGIPLEKAELRRLCAGLGTQNLRDLLEVKRADDIAQAPYIAAGAGRYAEAGALLDEILADGDALSVGDLAIGGDELIAAGIPRGPAIGSTLRTLLDAVLDEPRLNTKPLLLELAERIRAKQ